MSVADIKARLEAMGIQPKKAFGQNFLVNQSVIQKIIRTSLELEPHEIIEIGPGLGALTEPLLEQKQRPRLIELDRDLIEYWRQRGLDVIDADAIKLDWNTLNLKPQALLMSNLPYQISTHIVVDRCFGPMQIQHMVLMFQKEVAERLTAKIRTKDYGVLSVMAQLHFKMRKVTDAGPGDFFPPPKVASRVLAFERLPDPALGERFLKFLKASFAFRRKFMLKNLKAAVDKAKEKRLLEIWKVMGLSAKARAEELTPEQFATVFRRLNGN